MRQLILLLAAPWRLVLAVRRNGLGPVAVFLTLNLRRRGVAGALRMAQARRRARAEQAGGEVLSERATRAPDLDESFAMSAEAWRRWSPWVGAPDAAIELDPAALEPAAALYLVRGPKGAQEAFARTRSHIRQDAGAQLVELEYGAALTALPPGPPSRFVVFLRAGDVADPELAREIARAARGGVTEVVSFDLVRRADDRVFPMLAPGANPTLLRAADYLFGRVALRGEAIAAIADWAEADPRQLVLDWLDRGPPMQARGRWRHLGRPLVEAALTAEEVEAAVQNARKVGAQSPQALGRRASVVIVARQGGLALQQVVQSLLDAPGGAVAEVTIVASAPLADLPPAPKVQMIHADGAFNPGRLANLGARACGEGQCLLFLDETVLPQTKDWVARLLARFDAPAVGAAGPLLQGPDGEAADYLFTCNAPREVSVAPGCALMVSRPAFEAMNGFDDQFATGLHDIDLCLRLRRSGFVNILEPSAIVTCAPPAKVRRELESLRRDGTDADSARLQARWGAALRRDPYRPAGLDPLDPTLRRLSTSSGRHPPMRNGLPVAVD